MTVVIWDGHRFFFKYSLRNRSFISLQNLTNAIEFYVHCGGLYVYVIIIINITINKDITRQCITCYLSSSIKISLKILLTYLVTLIFPL